MSKHTEKSPSRLPCKNAIIRDIRNSWGSFNWLNMIYNVNDQQNN